MSNGNSKLPPNSGMSDERWMTRRARAGMRMRRPFANEARLLDHAEAADELIAELAECIDYWWSKHDCMGPDDCYCGGYDGPMMTARRRVDSLTKDTA